MCLIPFTQRFDGRRADPKLPEKLREDLPGVLAWAVEGCVAWFAEGLGSSRAVDAATAEYRSETDVLDRFFEDACEFGPSATHRVSKKDLFRAWERWCDAEGTDPGTQVAFTRTVGERGVVRGFEESKIEGVRVWKGVKLANSGPEPAPDGKVAPDKSPANSHIPEEPGQVWEDLQQFSPEALAEGFIEKSAKVAPGAPEELANGENGEVRLVVADERTWSGTRLTLNE